MLPPGELDERSERPGEPVRVARVVEALRELGDVGRVRLDEVEAVHQTALARAVVVVLARFGFSLNCPPLPALVTSPSGRLFSE